MLVHIRNSLLAYSPYVWFSKMMLGDNIKLIHFKYGNGQIVYNKTRLIISTLLEISQLLLLTIFYEQVLLFQLTLSYTSCKSDVLNLH